MSRKRRWGWSEGSRSHGVVFLEDVYPAERAGFVVDDPLHQASLMEHVFANLHLHVFLTRPHILKANGAFYILHRDVPQNRIEAVVDALVDFILLQADEDLGDYQEDSGDEEADDAVHVGEEVDVEVGQL